MARRGVTVNVSGMKELDGNLKRLSRRMGRAALERAGVEAAEPMARLARQLAPKDTGELAESIDVGTRASDVGFNAYAAAKKGGATDAQAVELTREARRRGKGDTSITVYVGPVAGRTKDEMIKAHVQEFGDFKNGPNAYLRPAFDQDKDAFMVRLRENLRFEVLAAVEKAQRLGRLKG